MCEREDGKVSVLITFQIHEFPHELKSCSPRLAKIHPMTSITAVLPLFRIIDPIMPVNPPTIDEIIVPAAARAAASNRPSVSPYELPALNATQPHHKMNVPRQVKTGLDSGGGSFLISNLPFLGPKYRHAIRPGKFTIEIQSIKNECSHIHSQHVPQRTWIGAVPAKSTTPIFLKNPCSPQIQPAPIE